VKIARIYLRVSTDEQDLSRQADIEHSTRAAGYYVAGIYREKASGARADRPELLRMISDLQPGEVVIAEKIDRISRLPLAEAEKLVASIRAKGARLAVPGLVDLHVPRHRVIHRPGCDRGRTGSGLTEFSAVWAYAIE